MQARDLPKIVQAAYRLIPYFIFSPEEGQLFMSRCQLFSIVAVILLDEIRYEVFISYFDAEVFFY